jgi:hypothetical protein
MAHSYRHSRGSGNPELTVKNVIARSEATRQSRNLGLRIKDYEEKRNTRFRRATRIKPKNRRRNPQKA